VKRIPFRIALLSFVTLVACTAANAQTVYTFPDQGFTPVYNFINSATKTLDMTMYELVDTTAENDLVALAKKGVVVRVILDQNLELSANTPAYTRSPRAVCRCTGQHQRTTRRTRRPSRSTRPRR